MEKDIEKLVKNKKIKDSPIKDDVHSIININSSIAKKNKENNSYEILEIQKAKTNMIPKTDRDNSLFNNLKNEENYSIEIDNEEEEEFNSDEYISSTNLDVETNTYIDKAEKKLNDSVSQTMTNKIKNKSPKKINDNQNSKKFLKNTNTNSKNDENSEIKTKGEISKTNSKKIKSNINNSPSPKIIKKI